MPTSGASSIRNGLRVYAIFADHLGGTAVGYYAPALGVQVTGNGPLAARTFGTLTRSPRSVALAAGSAPTVPSSWRRLSFGGISLAVPASWHVTHTTTFVVGCGSTPTSLLTRGGMVTFDTDAHVAVPACPLPQGQELITMPVDGVVIDGGLKAPYDHMVSGGCQSVMGSMAVCEGSRFPYSVLVLSVTVPGHEIPVFMSIGPAGNGMVARTILYSLR